MRTFFLLAIMVASYASATVSDTYGFLYWEHGWRGRSPAEERILSVQTNAYRAAFDVEKGTLVRLGLTPSPLPYSEAVSDVATFSDPLPDAALTIEIISDGTRYACIGPDLSQLRGLESPSRIIETGRYLQRFSIQKLRFKSEAGKILKGTGRLEVVAWPDKLSLILEMTGCNNTTPITLLMTVKTEDQRLKEEQVFDASSAAKKPCICLNWTPVEKPCTLSTTLEMTATAAKDEMELTVSYDMMRNWFCVELPAAQFDLNAVPEPVDRYALHLNNHSDRPVSAPLLFSLQGAFTGVIGMTPMLIDKQGNPTGLPVQISKNWHRQANKPELYEGPWFHGFAYIPLAPGETWEGTLQLVYATWGGVPAVSHSQLCLIGWGTNQQWDQVAIGSWGETICYDPDINLNRSMIDDVRPLMVHGMGSTPDAPKLWNWTNNVGGGDFLVLMDIEGNRQFPAHIRTAYLKSGPNLTETIYSGVTQDGAIKMRITASSPRCDDVARAWHHIRYDVLKPVPFSRLAFYQLGADNYNDHQFNKLARGDKNGLTEEWTFDKGSMTYDRKGIPCEGDAPWWFSMHDAIPRAPQGGAWANRGLIVRDWNARLGGKSIEKPYASFFGTDNGIPSMNVELTPPPELQQLEPGDFVDAHFELVVIPTSAEDYYGPNENLRGNLQQHGNSWQPVQRLAARNELQVTMLKGELLHPYPIYVNVDAAQESHFTISGGVGYVPITVTGVRDPLLAKLTMPEKDCIEENRLKQVNWNDKTSCYEITYNLLLDSADDTIQTTEYVFTAHSVETSNPVLLVPKQEFGNPLKKIQPEICVNGGDWGMNLLGTPTSPSASTRM